jgi:signal transduction histidine kinase/HD-like signal output (HDOD) protein
MVEAANHIYQKIISSRHLPSPPQVLLKLIEICGKEDTTPIELSQITAKDPSISSKVMRLVNSAYMGLTVKVNSLEKAILYLGLDTIKNIAISASVLQAFSRTQGNSSFKLKQFWWHSLMCASLSRRIAKKISYVSPEEAFLSGLLHDIGKLVLWVNFKKDYAEILKCSGNDADLLIAGETAIGATHYEVGAWLVRHWNLDSFMADAILYHHEPPERISNAFPLVKIVYVANALSKQQVEKPEDAPAIAKTVFGFSRSQVEELTAETTEEVIEVARSLEIAVEPPSGEEATEPEKDFNRSEALLREIRNFSLLYGTLQNLLKADTKSSILEIAERSLQILFDVKQTLFFLYDAEKDLLVGNLPVTSPRYDLISTLEIPTKEKSLPGKSLLQKRIIDSFGDEKTIGDEQIINLLGTDGIMCLPMIAHQKNVGVIIAGIYEPQFSRLSDQLKLLNMFANHVAMCLHVCDIKENQAKTIKSERMEAFSTVARKVAHEVNNPLGIIKNYLTILALKLPEKHPAQDELGIIGEEIDRVVHIIAQLSAFSQPAIKQYEPIDINLLITDLIKIIEKSILLPSGIEVHLSLDPSLPEVDSDKNSLKQVMINLIQNAAEAMPGGGNIFIETEYTRDAGKKPANGQPKTPGNVKITISDDGPGLPESIKLHLYEPFISSKGAGHSGLGLSIVQGIINELKGTITCQSDRETGTSFQIWLPISKS